MPASRDVGESPRIPGAGVAVSESFLRTQSELREALARRVRELRLASGMSQRELAEQADIRQALVSQIEQGEANVTLDSLLRIALALKVSAAGLLDTSRGQAPIGRGDD